MNLTADNIFSVFADATFGVYAVSTDQTVLFWNQAAERILGHQPVDVLGRRCYEVVAGAVGQARTFDCRQGCPSIRSLHVGQLPSTTQMVMVCASGERKLVLLTPMLVGGIHDESPVIMHMFTDANSDPEGDDGNLEDEAATVRDAPGLTRREIEVLRLVSEGWGTPRIAAELTISPHTVLNHIRHFRRKLGAPTKLDAVVSAIRLGILPIG